jgi:hypothetical protein
MTISYAYWDDRAATVSLYVIGYDDDDVFLNKLQHRG